MATIDIDFLVVPMIVIIILVMGVNDGLVGWLAVAVVVVATDSSDN